MKYFLFYKELRQIHEVKEGYREILLCEQDYPPVEPVTGSNFRDSSM
jgi:hypothetical protein